MLRLKHKPLRTLPPLEDLLLFFKVPVSPDVYFHKKWMLKSCISSSNRLDPESFSYNYAMILTANFIETTLLLGNTYLKKY